MTITRNIAERVHVTIHRCGTVQAAAHDCMVQLEAIKPYTDRELSKVWSVLAYIAGKTPETQAKLLAQLASHARAPIVAACDVEGPR